MKLPVLGRLRAPKRLLPVRGILHESRQCFLRGISPITEADSSFKLTDDGRTAAQQIAHAAQIVDFCVEGAVGSGFDYDYVAREEALGDVTSVTAAIASVNRAFDDAIDRFERAPIAVLLGPLPEGGMLSSEMAISAVGAILDGVAEQRGVLAAYIEALGRTPGFPYKFHHTLSVRVPEGWDVTG
jgi:hypothetical protein